MIATKMMKLSFVFDAELELPSAMPSAAAWMTRPVVVAMGVLPLCTFPLNGVSTLCPFALGEAKPEERLSREM